jgi:hypothetical protein
MLGPDRLEQVLHAVHAQHPPPDDEGDAAAEPFGFLDVVRGEKMVVPVAFSSVIKARMWRTLPRSIPVVGSSRNRMGGRWMIPAARVSLRFMPLE